MADTIAALSSGNLPAGIAVVRVTGPQSRFALETVFGRVPKPRFASYGPFLGSEGEVIDRGLALFFPGPHTESGEDGAEFQGHGGRAVVDALLARLTELPGIRLAEPGEFTRRAFLNGKIDFAEVEGLAALLSAETEAQRRLAIESADGHQSRQYLAWRGDLLKARASVEAELDFSDQDEIGEPHEDHRAVQRIASEMELWLSGAKHSEIVREGFRVVILGPVNAGKSSLLNALARRDVAIVSKEAGTTRDLIEVNLDLGGYKVIVTDTAGLRDSAGEIERIGMQRALQRASSANLVLWLAPSPDDAQTDLPEGVPVWRLRSKVDLCECSMNEPGFSAVSGAGIAELLSRLRAFVADSTGGQTFAPATIRQTVLLRRALASLRSIEPGLPAEVQAEYLREASASLGRIVGLVDAEELLGVIFSQFCIGK